MVASKYCAKFSVIAVCAVFLLSSDLVLAKSRVPISDAETREKKNECYSDIESGLWGEHCMSSTIAKENCALKCLSPICYELVYESDPGISRRKLRWH
ncbi:hypothetical protein AAHA92_04643 [Salvia divinorum]|uniref:Uncharacterized protein n=1 Tax=Salvia divinorum TaxID=28513 RepID=A0ABD1HZW9_SALDI